MTATPPATSTDSDIRALIDARDITEVIGHLCHLVDNRDWDRAETLFTDQVEVDYTSLNGGEPQTVPPADLVAGWRSALGGLDATQHLAGSYIIDVAGDEASSCAHVQATHRLENRTGDATWTVGGRWDFRLRRAANGWRFAAIRLTLLWTSGNRHIMQLASERANTR